MLTRGQKARRSQQQLDAIQALSGHVLELGPVATEGKRGGTRGRVSA